MDKLMLNGSGYKDLTAYKAIKNVTEEEHKVKLIIKTIQSVAHLAGFEIEGRVVLRDKTTGREWR